MHQIFGFSWDEIGNILTSIGIIAGAIAWVGHVLQKKVTNPINRLSKKLSAHSKQSLISMTHFNDKFKDHEDRLTYLEKEVEKLIEKIK